MGFASWLWLYFAVKGSIPGDNVMLEKKAVIRIDESKAEEYSGLF